METNVIYSPETERNYPTWRSTESPRTYARLILASKNSRTGSFLITLELNFHRWVLAEFNTHRVFTRNSASTRAIPVGKRLAEARDTPAMPVVWATEQKGMQGGEPLPEDAALLADKVWNDAAQSAAMAADALSSMGVHKSIAGRLIEPFLFHRVVVTATSWQGFLAQRASLLAQPEIRVAAECVVAALKAAQEPSNYQVLVPGISNQQWHTPYVDNFDRMEITKWWQKDGNEFSAPKCLNEAYCWVSAARCARSSYMTQDGRRDPGEDARLYKRLTTAEPIHASPLEHVAVAVSEEQRGAWPGNFDGYAQLRHFVEAGISIW